MARPLSLEEFRREISDEASARRLLERLVWPQGPYCPRCGSFRVWRFRDEGRRSRDGLLQCGEGVCGRPFTATTLTPLHATKLPLRVRLEAIHLPLTSSKGVSSVVLARQIGVKQPTAWKMGHAIRALMARWHDAAALLGGIVEVDTKRIGGAPRRRRHVHNPRGKGSKKPIVLVAADRGGQVKAVPVPDERAETLGPAIHRFVDRRAGLMSDADKALMKVGRDFASHDTVNHGQGLYARGPKSRRIHSNSADRFAGTLERTKLGVFHFFSRKHLHRYVDEAAWRSSNREKVPRNSKGRTRWVLEPRPVLDLLADLMPLALGLQIRRERKSGGFREVSVSG
jgi:hypothetical protein